MAEVSDPAARRRWRLLRWLLPRGFRERRAADVLATHVALAGGPTRARGVGFWARVGWDVAATSARLRWDARPSSGGRDSNRARNPMAIVDELLRSGALAVRTLKRSPGFALAVILILALGISANVTMFRVLDRLLLSPPEQIESAEEVKRLYIHGPTPFSDGRVVHSAALSYPDYRGFTEVSSFDGVGGYSQRSLTMDVEGVGVGVTAELATASYFELLGVRPALGRFYGADEDALGAEAPVAVLSWSLWQQQFGGERSVLGRTLAIGKATYTVIGVAPRGFTGVDIQPVDVWLPLLPAAAAESAGTTWVEAPNWYMMAGVARVSGSLARAESEASLVRRRVHANASRTDADARVVLTPIIAARGPNPSRESRVARMLALLTGLVLLITCANVGNLYLSRVLSRRRELAIQAALGVSRARLFAQLILEVTIVALVAGVVAWWAAGQAATGLFRVLLPDAAPPTDNAVRVLLLTVALALATALLTGVLPALRATRVAAIDVLRRGTATRRILLLRRSLLLVQAALSVVLLAGAGLFIRSLQRAQAVDFGIDTSALVIDVELPGGIAFGEELTGTVLRVLPIVRESRLIESAAAASLAPFSGFWGVDIWSAEGDTVAVSGEGPSHYGVSGDYFATLGLPIVRGRALTDADAAPGAQPVAVVSERLAARLWPDRDAIGRCFTTEQDEPGACTTVVGMVRDFLRSALPELRRVEVARLHDRIAHYLRAWQLGATLLSAVGVLALVIAAAGLYSMLAFDVLQRRRELGIRAALGASVPRLVHGAVGASFGVVAAGVLIGLGASLLAGRAVEAMLFRVTAHDPAVYAAVCGVMLAVGLIAGAIPARAVTRTDPAIPLREE